MCLNLSRAWDGKLPYSSTEYPRAVGTSCACQWTIAGASYIPSFKVLKGHSTCTDTPHYTAYMMRSRARITRTLLRQTPKSRCHGSVSSLVLKFDRSNISSRPSAIILPSPRAEPDDGLCWWNLGHRTRCLISSSPAAMALLTPAALQPSQAVRSVAVDKLADKTPRLLGLVRIVP